ncbi:MAG: radical SAM protein [Candidatus Omnitrophota bacterium]
MPRFTNITASVDKAPEKDTTGRKNPVQNYPALYPHYFYLQWHITERCNWRCRHCYQLESEKENKELSLGNLLKIFRQYLRLIGYFNTLGPRRSRLSITGGEPLVRNDLFDFLKKISRYNKYFFLSIFTNGSLITREAAERLKALGVRQVQVSLEGLQRNNDIIRGDGAFLKTIRAVKILVGLNVNVAVSVTLTRKNVSDIPELIRLCKRLGVRGLGLRRLVPIGRGVRLMEDMLNPLELRRVYAYIQREWEKTNRQGRGHSLFRLSRGCEEGIFSREVNQPLNSCAVMDGRCLIVLHNGDVVPCRRLPIRLGNALEEDLIRIFYTSDRLRQLRNLNNASALCLDCSCFESCLSGARCISHAYFDKISVPDPQCWKLFKKLPAPNLYDGTVEKSSPRQRVHPRLLPIDKNGR